MHKFLLCLTLLFCTLPCFAQTIPKVGGRREIQPVQEKIHQNIPALIARLKSPIGLDKVQALNALSLSEEEAAPAIPAIAALLGDTSPPVSNYIGSGMPTYISALAADVLSAIGPASIPTLISVLQSGSDEARVNASWALKSLSELDLNRNRPGLDLDLWPIILDALQNKNEIVSHRAASILLNWQQRPGLALYSLESLNTEQTLLVSLALPIEPFLRVSHDKRPFVRATILEFLRVIADGRSRERIFEALRDEDDSVRQAAVSLISRLGGNWLYDPRALEPLLLATHEDYAKGRYVSDAVKSLERYQETGVFETLVRVLKTSEDVNGRSNAAWILGKRKESRAVEPLIEALRDESKGYVPNEVFLALAELGDKRALPIMAAYLPKSSKYHQFRDAFEKLAGQSYEEYKTAQQQDQPH